MTHAPSDLGRARRAGWRHEALAAKLLADIEAGVYRVGDALPTERSIAETHGLSRGTVREALRALEGRGLVRRRQGSGTVVIANRPTRFLQSIDSLDTLLAYPANTTVRLDGSEVLAPDPILAAELGPGDDRAWRRATMRRFLQGADLPISHSDVWISEAHAAVIADIDGSAVPVFRLLEGRFGLVAADVALRIEAMAAPPDIAASLRVAPDTPAIRIVRIYRDADGGLFQISVTTHPGGRYAFEAKMQRRDGVS